MARPSVHALPALAVVLCALLLPLAGGSGSAAQAGEAGSVTARAAQNDGSPGGDQRFPVGSPEFELARTTAESHWGTQPCGGNYQLVWTPLDQGTNATASWRNPTDAWNNAGANFDCRIDINPQTDFDFPKLCTVLTHEMGHLLGQQHDPNPDQLMSAYYSTPIPACRTQEPASTGVAPSTLPATDDADGVDIIATDEPRRVLRKKTTAKTKYKFVKRCTTRKSRSGKRVKRCRTVKVKLTAKKPSAKAKKRV